MKVKSSEYYDVTRDMQNRETVRAESFSSFNVRWIFWRRNLNKPVTKDYSETIFTMLFPPCIYKVVQIWPGLICV